MADSGVSVLSNEEFVGLNSNLISLLSPIKSLKFCEDAQISKVRIQLVGHREQLMNSSKMDEWMIRFQFN